MCGSIAIVRSPFETEAVAKSALDRLASRGPDGSGLIFSGSGAIGHCRLALRDHNGGAQPVTLSDGRKLAFVGELYNDGKLRRLLELQGARFSSASDTETLAAAIERWGGETWSKLDGMFAMMLLSAHGDSVHLISDKYGVKPIFYSQTVSTSAAASQPSSLLSCGAVQKAHAVALLHYLRTSQVCLNTQTVLSDVKLMSPGSVVTLFGESANQVRWSASPFQSESLGPCDQSASKLRYLLSEAVYRQSSADSPVGVFLSGGLDSSILAALLQMVRPAPLKTFAVALAGDTDDLDYSKLVSERIKSEHVELVVSPEEFFKSMRELIAERALPLSLPNEVLIYELSKRARDSVKAILSGEGADELFGGYHRLLARVRSDGDWPLFIQRYRNVSSWFSLADLEESLSDPAPLLAAVQTDADYLGELLRDARPDSFLRTLLFRDHFRHLLLRLDGSAMAGSIEGRVPFTDPDVVHFAIGLPEAALMPAFGLEKPLLRKAADGLLPATILRRPKRAFNASLSILFTSNVGQRELNSALQQPLICKLFRKEKLEQILNEDFESQVFHRTWLICSLGLWNELCGVSEIC
ncbi:asparagine synthase (glutamine-hydrolyzing) [bacterium]|nr:asparagine synthase (glutamine-hydrolyzing) [bacterium]